jgi:hypothetical protein
MSEPAKCANCGVDIIPTEEGWTHTPTTFIAECAGGASPAPTSWWEIQPKDSGLAQCSTCAALVLKTGLDRHMEWHAEHGRGETS